MSLVYSITTMLENHIGKNSGVEGLVCVKQDNIGQRT